MTENTNEISPPDAIAIICIWAIQADMRIKTSELKKLASIIALSPLYRHVENPVEYISCLNNKFSGQDIEQLLNSAIEVLTPRLRETAYAWACEVVVADLGVSQEEHACLGLLVKKLGLHGELAGKILAVVAILNRKEL